MEQFASQQPQTSQTSNRLPMKLQSLQTLPVVSDNDLLFVSKFIIVNFWLSLPQDLLSYCFVYLLTYLLENVLSTSRGDFVIVSYSMILIKFCYLSCFLIAEHENWYSFYCPTDSRRLSRPGSPIRVLTGPNVEQLRWSRHDVTTKDESLLSTWRLQCVWSVSGYGWRRRRGSDVKSRDQLVRFMSTFRRLRRSGRQTHLLLSDVACTRSWRRQLHRSVPSRD